MTPDEWVSWVADPKPIILESGHEIDSSLAPKSARAVAEAAGFHGWRCRVVRSVYLNVKLIQVECVTVRFGRQGVRGWAAWHAGSFEVAWLRGRDGGFEQLGWVRSTAKKTYVRRALLEVIEGA